MCIQSLARKSISVLLKRSTVGIDQLAGRLGGNCYFYHLGTEGVTQTFLFESEGNAHKFFEQALENFPEVISATYDLFSDLSS